MRKHNSGIFLKRIRRISAVAAYFALALLLCLQSTGVFALTDEELDRYSEAGVIFYDPSGCNSVNNSASAQLVGDNVEEKIWFYFVNSNLKNVSDNPKAIAAILGNYGVESGYNMLLIGHNAGHKYYSLSMNHEDYGGEEMAGYVNETLRKNYFSTYRFNGDTSGYINSAGELSSYSPDVVLKEAGVTMEEMDTALKIVLDFQIFGQFNGQTVTRTDMHNNFTTYQNWLASNKDASLDEMVEYFDKHVERSGGGHTDMRKSNAKAVYDRLAEKTSPQSDVSSVGGGSAGSYNSPIAKSYEITDNKNYKGDQVWTDSELETVRKFQPIYEASAAKAGLPDWRILAVLHWKEHSLSRTNPSNGQGIYQLYSLTESGTTFEPGLETDDAEFARQTDMAAEYILGKSQHAKNKYNIEFNTIEGIAWAFYAYNGIGYNDKAKSMGYSESEYYNGSVYVMNRIDARRDPTGDSMDPLWGGRYTADGVLTEGSTTNRWGALVLYIALGGTIGNVNSCSGATGAGNMDIAKTALDLAWPLGDPHNCGSCNEPKPEYIVAMKALGVYGGGLVGRGSSCDKFVWTSVRYSGADTHFGNLDDGSSDSLTGPISRLWKYLHNHSGYDYMAFSPTQKNTGVTQDWQFVGENMDESELRPGDVLIQPLRGFYKGQNKGGCGHIVVHVEVDGVGRTANASHETHTGIVEKWVETGITTGVDGVTCESYRAFRKL